MATGKSHKDGGYRTGVRHNFENLGAGSIAWVILNRIDALEAPEKTALLVGMMALGSWGAKVWNQNQITAKLLKKIGLSALIVSMLSGCALNIGQVTPDEYTGVNGETIIACELKGIQFGVFDGGVCRNVEGGQVGRTFVDLFTGAVEAVGRILGGILTGFSAAGSALGTPVLDAPQEVQSVTPDQGAIFE